MISGWHADTKGPTWIRSYQVLQVPLRQRPGREMRRSGPWNWGTLERRVHCHCRQCVRPAADNSLILPATELMEWLWQRHKVEPDHSGSPLWEGIPLSVRLIWVPYLVPPVDEPGHPPWLARIVIILHLDPRLANINRHNSMTSRIHGALLCVYWQD